MRWLWLFILVPTLVSSEPVAIRSGEHETFSRLVLSIATGSRWSVAPTQSGYEVSVQGASDGFDTSQIFTRIPRSRIEGASGDRNGRLSLDVTCDCHFNAFLWQPDRLVVDIKDGPSPDAQDTPSATRPPAIRPQRETLPDLLLTGPTPAPQFGPLAALPLPTGFGQPSQDVQDAESALIEGLARAASQGFLNAAIMPTNLTEREVEPATVASPQVIEPVLVPARPGIGVETAMDRDLGMIRDVIGAQFPSDCLPADFFDIAAWGDDRPFHTQVGELSESLAEEFGEQPLAAQDNLARLYLHFGFGAEARVVLSVDNAQSRTRQVLVELAGLIDDYEGVYPLIREQVDCDTGGALWAFFLAPRTTDDERRNSILQEFFSLPQPLRGQMAPRLARRFVEIGDPDSAEKLLRATEANDAEATHDVQATRALIAEELEDPRAAIYVLSGEAGDNARTTPESLIRLIELGVENDVLPLEADLVLAGAMQLEYRDTPIADRLAVAESIGRTQLGDYATAIDLVRDRTDVSALAAIDTAFAHIAINAPAAEFLEFSYSDPPDGISSSTENAIARRLIDLGFAERALDFVSGQAQREAAAERRYLRAEAFLATGDYSAAIDGLLGVNDRRARDLRAAAFEGLGEHRAALVALGQDAEIDSAALQFRAGAWDRLIAENDSVLSEFAQTVLTEPSQTPPQTLNDRREVLAQSQESRRAVEGLLMRFDGLPAGD